MHIRQLYGYDAPSRECKIVISHKTISQVKQANTRFYINGLPPGFAYKISI